MHVGVADLLVQEISHGPVELGRDLLRLVADRHPGNAKRRGAVLVTFGFRLALLVGLEEAGHHPDEGRLARPVLAEHDDDLAIPEGSPFHVKREDSPRAAAGLLLGPHGLRHGRIRVHGAVVVELPALGGKLRHLELQRFLAEPQVLRGDEAGQEDVDALAHRERHGHDTVRARRAIQAADEVAQVVQNGQVVLHHEDVLVFVILPQLDNGADDLSGLEPLLHVQVGRRLVEHVYVRILDRDDADGEALQLPAAEHVDASFQVAGHVQLLDGPIEVVPLVLRLENLQGVSLDRARDVVHVLGLDDRDAGLLEDAHEVVLQLGAPEVCVDLSPVWRRVIVAQVGLQLARENLQRSGLADAVGPNQAEHLTGPRHGQAVQLERVRPVAMRDVLLQILWQVDDRDGLEGALLGADVAADAERLRDEGDLGVGRDLDAQLALAHHRTLALAFLPAMQRRGRYVTQPLMASDAQRYPLDAALTTHNAGDELIRTCTSSACTCPCSRLRCA
eukprot:scaffold301_cov243-Pinguiococcus_pyrenoidosus.AAC.54